MPDIVTFIKSTGVPVYNSGRGVIGANMLGQYNRLPEAFNKNVVVFQSGSLDTRFDDIRYYSSSG